MVAAQYLIIIASFWLKLVAVVQSLSGSDSLQPHDCSMLDFPVCHYFLKFAQTHVH